MPRAAARIARRMILADRVLGSAATRHTRDGANGLPSSRPTKACKLSAHLIRGLVVDLGAVLGPCHPERPHRLAFDWVGHTDGGRLGDPAGG